MTQDTRHLCLTKPPLEYHINIFFLFLQEMLWLLSEVPQCGTSNEYPKICFCEEIRKISQFLTEKTTLSGAMNKCTDMQKDSRHLDIYISLYVARHLSALMTRAKQLSDFINLLLDKSRKSTFLAFGDYGFHMYLFPWACYKVISSNKHSYVREW